MKAIEVLIIAAVGLGGLAAWQWSARRGSLAAAQTILANLPREPTWQERAAARDAAENKGIAAGAIQGASVGAVAGPWGIAIGAGAGAIAAWVA
jgi:hypothetical protein